MQTVYVPQGAELRSKIRGRPLYRSGSLILSYLVVI